MIERPYQFRDPDSSLHLRCFLRHGRLEGMSQRQAADLVEGYYRAAKLRQGGYYLLSLGWTAEQLAAVIFHFRIPVTVLPCDPVNDAYLNLVGTAGGEVKESSKAHESPTFSPDTIRLVITLMNEMGFASFEPEKSAKAPMNGRPKQKTRVPQPYERTGHWVRFPNYLAALETLAAQARTGKDDGYLELSAIKNFFPKEQSARHVRFLCIQDIIEVYQEQQRSPKKVQITDEGKELLILLREAWQRKELPVAPMEASIADRADACAAEMMGYEQRTQIAKLLGRLNARRNPVRAMKRQQFHDALPGTNQLRAVLLANLERLTVIKTVEGKIILAERTAMEAALTGKRRQRKSKAPKSNRLPDYVRLTAAKEGGVGVLALRELKHRLKEEHAQGALQSDRTRWKKAVKRIVEEEAKGIPQGNDRGEIVTAVTHFGIALRETLRPPRPDSEMVEELRRRIRRALQEKLHEYQTAQQRREKDAAAKKKGGAAARELDVSAIEGGLSVKEPDDSTADAIIEEAEKAKENGKNAIKATSLRSLRDVTK